MESKDFAWALCMMRQGKRVARKNWNGKGMFIAIQYPDTNSKMRRDYIFMSPVDQALVPWVASQADLLSSDWVEVI